MGNARRVFVGLIEESEVVACSEESVERHKAWNWGAWTVVGRFSGQWPHGRGRVLG